MKYQAKKIDQSALQWATDSAISRKESIVRKALNITNDPQKKERKEKSLCVIHYYQEGRMGGAAMCTQPCGICNEEQVYGSTATDALCLKCATAYKLCKECGADLELKPRRKL